VLEVQVTGRSVGRKRGHQVGPGGVLEVHETGGEYEKGGGGTIRCGVGCKFNRWGVVRKWDH